MKNPENRKQSHAHDFPKIKSSKTKSGKKTHALQAHHN